MLIVLNIIFWSNLYNLYSIVLGAVNVFTFLQPTPKRVRYCSIVAEIMAIVYFSLLFTPVNIVIEVVGLISAVVGIIRLDVKKRIQSNKPSEVKNNQEKD